MEKNFNEHQQEAYRNTLVAKAESNDVEALYQLGVCYQYGGYGTEKSMSKAIEWHEKAAELGNLDAQLSLAFLYYNKGEYVTQNYEKAVHYLNLAFKQGNEKAECNLGFCYLHGDGVPQNRAKGLTYIFRAAQKGDNGAQKKVKEYGFDWNAMPTNDEIIYVSDGGKLLELKSGKQLRSSVYSIELSKYMAKKKQRKKGKRAGKRKITLIRGLVLFVLGLFLTLFGGLFVISMSIAAALTMITIGGFLWLYGIISVSRHIT